MKIIQIACLLGGMWLFCDGWFSLSVYLDRKGQSWWKDHIIRVVRLAWGLAFIFLGIFLEN